MSYFWIDKKKTLTQVLRELPEEYLTAYDLAKAFGLDSRWIKNKFNSDTYNAKNIEKFEYRNTHFYSKIEFVEWYEENYNKKLKEV